MEWTFRRWLCFDEDVMRLVTTSPDGDDADVDASDLPHQRRHTSTAADVGRRLRMQLLVYLVRYIINNIGETFK